MMLRDNQSHVLFEMSVPLRRLRRVTFVSHVYHDSGDYIILLLLQHHMVTSLSRRSYVGLQIVGTYLLRLQHKIVRHNSLPSESRSFNVQNSGTRAVNLVSFFTDFTV